MWGLVPAKVLTRLTRPPHVVHFGALAKTPGRKMRAACGLAQRGAGLVHVRFPQASHKPENLRPRSGRRHIMTCQSGGEHPVSAKFRGLRNRFIRWWVLGAPHEQPIFTSVFGKNVIFAGANRVSATFQLRFSCVSATFQLRFSSLEFLFDNSFLFGPKISAFLKVKLLAKPLFFVFQLRFSWQKRGAHPLASAPSKHVFSKHVFSKHVFSKRVFSTFPLFEMSVIL